MNGCVLFNGTSHQIPEYMAHRLKTNDKRSWLQSFCPSTEEERNILCNVGKYYHPEHINLTEKSEESIQKAKDYLLAIIEQYSGQDLWDKLHENGYVIIKKEEEYYCIDFAHRMILNINSLGLDVSRLRGRTESTNKQDMIIKTPKLYVQSERIITKKGGSSDNNREWEIDNDSYGDVDDERKMKR